MLFAGSTRGGESGPFGGGRRPWPVGVHGAALAGVRWPRAVRLVVAALVALGWTLLLGCTSAAAVRPVATQPTGTFTVTLVQGEYPDGCSDVQAGDTVYWRPDTSPPAYHLTIHRTHPSTGTPWLGTTADTDWKLFPTNETSGSARRWTTQPTPVYDSRGNLTTRGWVADAYVSAQGIGPVTLQAIRASDGYGCRFQLGSQGSLAPPPTRLPTTTPDVAPQAGLVCDTGALPDTGQVTCAASVLNRIGAAVIVYRWTVDGVPIPNGNANVGPMLTNVADNVLTLTNVAADGTTHTVQVRARDTANNLSSDSPVVTFARAPAASVGPVPPPPPLGPTETTTETTTTEQAAPPGPGTPGPAGASTSFPFIPVSAGTAAAVALATLVLRRVLRQRRACLDILPRARRVNELNRAMRDLTDQLHKEWRWYKAESDKYEHWRADIDSACGFFDFRNGYWFCPLGARGGLAAARVFNTVTLGALVTEGVLKFGKWLFGWSGLSAGLEVVKWVACSCFGWITQKLTPSFISPNPVTDFYGNKIVTNLVEMLREQANNYVVAADRLNQDMDRWKASALQRVDALSRDLRRELDALRSDCRTCPDARGQADGLDPSAEPPDIQLPYVSEKFTDPWLSDL